MNISEQNTGINVKVFLVAPLVLMIGVCAQVVTEQVRLAYPLYVFNVVVKVGYSTDKILFMDSVMELTNIQY
jgi:hypothetical protein